MIEAILGPEAELWVTKKPIIWTSFGNVVVAATPKVASTAIRNASGNCPQIPNDKVHLHKRVVAFIRDPLERLESAYHYFTQQDSWPRVWNKKQGMLVHGGPVDYEDFVDRILEEQFWDKHWYPQTALLGGRPTEHYLFEDLVPVIASLGRTIPVENASGVPKTTPSYRREDLLQFYAEDNALRERLKKESTWTKTAQK